MLADLGRECGYGYAEVVCGVSVDIDMRECLGSECGYVEVVRVVIVDMDMLDGGWL